MSFAAAFATISLTCLGVFLVVLLICALGRCNHELYWHHDHDKVIKRCNCGERIER